MLHHGEFYSIGGSPPRTNKTPDLHCKPQAREAVTVSATLAVSARVGPAAPSRAAASSHLRSSTAARGYRGSEPLSADADLSLLVPPRPDKTCAHEDRAPSPVVPTCQLLEPGSGGTEPPRSLRGPSPGYRPSLGTPRRWDPGVRQPPL